MTKRAAIYGRYSTDLQSERSADDQLQLCREFAKARGFTVVLEQKDEAKSGGSLGQRPGIQSLLEAAERREFDALIVESVDRMTRDFADAGKIKKTFDFLRIAIFGVNQSSEALDSFQVGIHSVIGQFAREEGAKKVRRGMRANASDGRHMGGRPYGFIAHPTEVGALQVSEAEAPIVLRIFQEYAAGATPRKIAQGLNNDRIPAPRGKSWNASTINGSKQRGNGIIQNRLYKGDIVWGKVEMVKNPCTGKRISRPREEPLAIQEAAIPALVPIDLWNTVANIKADKSHEGPAMARKAKRPLSGLLKCGACGGGMSSRGTDKTGKMRIQCSRHAEGGACPDPRTFYLEAVERKVFGVLGNALGDQEMLNAFVKTYNDERSQMAADSIQERIQIKRQLEKIDHDCRRWTEMLFDGIGDAKTVSVKTKALREQEAVLAARLENLDETDPEVVFKPEPNLAARYASVTANLQKTLATGSEVSNEIVDAVRTMVSKVVIRRGVDGDPDVETFGLIRALAFPGPSGGPNDTDLRYHSVFYGFS